VGGEGVDGGVSCAAGGDGATVTNLMETPEGAPLTVTGDVVKAPIHPYEILTIRVDYVSRRSAATGRRAGSMFAIGRRWGWPSAGPELR
jgi:hypothetical protein